LDRSSCLTSDWAWFFFRSLYPQFFFSFPVRQIGITIWEHFLVETLHFSARLAELSEGLREREREREGEIYTARDLIRQMLGMEKLTSLGSLSLFYLEFLSLLPQLRLRRNTLPPPEDCHPFAFLYWSLFSASIAGRIEGTTTEDQELPEELAA